MSQSRRMSLFEAVTNVTVGYVLAVATQIVVFPWFGLHASFGDNMGIGAVFTCISLIRGYALRRLFELIAAGNKKGPAEAGP
jgi:hypothetical protein